MDTRQKIVEPAAVPRSGRRLRVIIGYFDPFYAAHVRRLREVCTPDAVNVAVVDTPEGSEYLPARARAELIAALGCIDFVVARIGELEPIDELLDERPADLERRAAIEKHVVARHR